MPTKAVAWRVAYVGVAKFGESGLENLKIGRELLDAIENTVDADEEFGDPYIRLSKWTIEEITKQGRTLPDKALRRNVDLNIKQIERLKKSMAKMCDKVAPEGAAPILDFLDGIAGATEVEYAPKAA